MWQLLDLFLFVPVIEWYFVSHKQVILMMNNSRIGMEMDSKKI